MVVFYDINFPAIYDVIEEWGLRWWHLAQRILLQLSYSTILKDGQFFNFIHWEDAAQSHHYKSSWIRRETKMITITLSHTYTLFQKKNK